MPKITGKAMHQDGIHELIQRPKNPSLLAVARQVERPDTRNDAKPDRMKANNIGANLGEIIELKGSNLDRFCRGPVGDFCQAL